MPSQAFAPRSKPVVLADLISGSTLLVDTTLVIVAACVVGALAQLSIHLSFTPVPITGQTLGVLVAGTSLGWKRGATSMGLYGVAGVLGVPWFADHTSGYVGASFGYILGFVICAALCGRFAEYGTDRSVLKALPAMLAGEFAIYAVGVLWLKFDLGVGVASAIAMGLTPFLIGDAIKLCLAAIVLPSTWAIANRKRRDDGW
jgi:biotin transport system substrate-specific component